MKVKKKMNSILRILSAILCMAMIFGVLMMTSCNKEEAKSDDNSEQKAGEELVEVLRLIDDIKIGGKFTNDKLQVVKVRADVVPEGAYSDVALLTCISL